MDHSAPLPETSDVSNAMLAGILAIAADAIVTVDDAQRIMNFNQGAEQIFGYCASEIIGKPLEVLLPERYRSVHEEHVRHFGQGRETARRMGHRQEIFGRRKNGEEFPAEASISRLVLPNGHTVYSAVLRDVTERKRLEQEQRFLAFASDALAQSLDLQPTLTVIPQLPVPHLAHWCTLDAIGVDGGLTHTASTHIDASRQAALDQLTASYPTDEDSPWFTIDVLRRGQVTAIQPVTEAWLDAHVHDARHAELLRDIGVNALLGVPLHVRNDVVGVLTFGRLASAPPFDEYEISLAHEYARRAAMALDHARLYFTAQRVTRARDVVLGVVSHDLRNPITAIERCARVLRDNPADNVDRSEMVTTIADAASWSQRLIRDLLDVATIDAGRLSLEREPVDVAEVVAQVVQLFARQAAERAVHLHVNVPEHLPLIHADRERVVQLLANLVDNAIKYSERDGAVTIRAELAGALVRFVVIDTGTGIAEADLPHVFDLYWQARRANRVEGSGYGLSIARGIAEAHGGEIWAESEPTKGSTFQFTIPAAHTAAAIVMAKSSPA
jgi:PAS domain S-box-containing protein